MHSLSPLGLNKLPYFEGVEMSGVCSAFFSLVSVLSCRFSFLHLPCPRKRPPSKPKMNFFTSDDIDELLHSTFFIKMCDDASWLFVEEHPYQPELNWLLSLWGGYKIAPRFPGEVWQQEHLGFDPNG